MSLYNYWFNTPRLLSNPAYYHKLISCNTFIYISKISRQHKQRLEYL
ncbi:hypothetical protein [Vibrio phage J14]|nr:hypothetical protein [Vibrio phage J14]